MYVFIVNCIQYEISRIRSSCISRSMPLSAANALDSEVVPGMLGRSLSLILMLEHA